MYLDRKFGLGLSLSEITLLFDLSLYLDRTLAQWKAQRKAKSKASRPLSWYNGISRGHNSKDRKEKLKQNRLIWVTK